MTDWIKHNGGPQPVGDDVWVEVDEGHIDYLVGPARDFEWDRVEWFRWNIINQHLIDAARLEGIRLGLEAAAKAALLNSHAEPPPSQRRLTSELPTPYRLRPARPLRRTRYAKSSRPACYRLDGSDKVPTGPKGAVLRLAQPDTESSVLTN